jgi:putative iron-only hydrogenase system regulator
MDSKIAVIGIVLINKQESVKKVNDIISTFGDIIIGRMGIPYRRRGISVISLIADGTTDEIGALTGKLGNIKHVKVRVAFTY